MPLPVVLVVDTGVDDALALIVAACHPGLQLCGVVCTAGNVPVGTSLANTLYVLDVAGRSDVPVAVGADRRLDGTPFVSRPAHGPDGLAALAPVAVEVPPSSPPPTAVITPDIVVVSLGPLTSLVSLPVRRVVGSYVRPGEANHDQDALAALVLAGSGRSIEHVAADRPGIVVADLGLLADDEEPLARLTAGLLRHQAGRGAGLGDAAVVLALAEPQLEPASYTRRLIGLALGKD